MKKFVLTILFFLLLFSGFSQSPFPTRENMDAFLNSKTLVVLDNSSFLGYNIYIKKAVQEYWKITDYDFVDYKELEKRRYDSTYSFLMLTKISIEKDKEEAYYNFLNLLLGGNAETITDMPEFGSVPLSYTDVDEKKYIYKLGLIVQFLQDHVKFIEQNIDMTALGNLKYYNKNIPLIKDKVLLIAEGDLTAEVDSMDKIKEIYPYEIKIVPHAEIEKAIDNRDENIVFLHKVGPEGTNINARCYKIIIGANDGKFYFFNFHTINNKRPDGFLARDFKRIARF